MSTIAKTCRDNLATLTAAYCKATGHSLQQVSRQFYGHRLFLTEFASGDRSISVDKFDEVLDAFIKAWPPETPWPALQAIIIPRQRPKRGKPSLED